MCGIAGMICLENDKSQAIDETVLADMVQRLRHRGPDGKGLKVLNQGRVGLGHRRLSIIDLSELGAQPLSNEDGSIWVTFNGEIYNYRKLRHRLQQEGHRFRSQTDTEVLVHLYEELGESMVEQLDGDFAFGLWDQRRHRLLLARDPAGVKPLYYTRTGNFFLFASEIKALLAHPDVKKAIDSESLYHYLTYLVVPPPRTLFQGVYKMPAATLATLSSDDSSPDFRPTKYWEPLPGQMRLEQDLDAQLADLLQQSVDKRMMSDVPIGTLFSGGVDSTLNTVFFQKAIAPRRVRTYHAAVEGHSWWHKTRDESHVAKEMAARLGTEHYEVRVSPRDLVETAQLLPFHQDEPISDPVSIPLYFVTKLAKETGTTVLHAGEGADEIFCGYGGYRRWLRHYSQLWKPLSLLPAFVSGLAFEVLRRSHGHQHRKMADVLLRRSKGQEFFQSAAVAYYEAEKQLVLSPDFRRELRHADSFEAVEPLYRRIEAKCPDADFLQRLTFIELQLRLPELLLMRVDKMSLANAVEVRVPFLDRNLVDFALSASQSFKLRDGVSKEPLKRLAAQFVDRERVYKPKQGFGLPIQLWLEGEVGEHMRSLLEEDRIEVEGFFDVEVIKARLQGPIAPVNQAIQLWAIYNFMNWRRAYFGG